MKFDGLNVMIDGLNLESLQGTGIKTYGIGLAKALKSLGANPHVLISKYSLKGDKEINADALAIFQEMPRFHLWKYNYSLVAKTLFGFSGNANSTDVPQKMVITEGTDGFEYFNRVGFYLSRSCYQIADYMRLIGRKVKIKTDPKMDVWHATYFTPIVIPGAKKITTVHDLIPLRLPHTTLNDKGFFIQSVRDALKHSDLILCVSENTKADLLRYFDFNPEKVVVTYQSVILDTAVPDKETILRKLSYYNLEYKDYLLFVGAIEPKKNLKRIIEACLTMDMDTPLAIAGQKAWLWENELKALSVDFNGQKIREKIRLLDYVPNSDLPLLYRGAKCLVFPSLYEGFGLPLLEAMSLGCPVITSSVSSPPEICGDAALYADPYNTDDIADKIGRILNENDLCDNLAQAGLERAKYFSMENYAGRLAEAYARVL